MEIQENNAGLGKNHDESASEKDLAKKQSDAQPAADLEMEPYSVNKDGQKEFQSSDNQQIDDKAKAYAKQEHDKADNWENPNKTGPDSPSF